MKIILVFFMFAFLTLAVFMAIEKINRPSATFITAETRRDRRKLK